MVTFIVKSGTDGIDWQAVCAIFPLAPLGTRDPEKLRLASEKSYAVCTAYADEAVIGFGRALSDGQYQSAIYDMVVLPDYQGKGVGRAIMDKLMALLPVTSNIIIYAAPGKEPFYRKLGFGRLTTGMGRFADPDKARRGGYFD